MSYREKGYPTKLARNRTFTFQVEGHKSKKTDRELIVAVPHQKTLPAEPEDVFLSKIHDSCIFMCSVAFQLDHNSSVNMFFLIKLWTGTAMFNSHWEIPLVLGHGAFKAGPLNFQEVTEVKEKAVDKVLGRLRTWGVPKFETDEVKGLGV